MSFQKVTDVIKSREFLVRNHDAYIAHFILCTQKKIADELPALVDGEQPLYRVTTFANGIVTVGVVSSTVSNSIRYIEKNLRDYFAHDFPDLHISRFRYKTMELIELR